MGPCRVDLVTLINGLSVRRNIREGHDDFLVAADSWPTFCYAQHVCNVADIEFGLFRGPLLLKVRKLFVFSLLGMN